MNYFLQSVQTPEQSVLAISDIIQLASVLVAVLVGLISIVISIITLRQNSKMIESSTRPYIVISFETLHNGNPTPYFVLKNYGSAGATITSFKFDDSLEKVKEPFFYQQFESIPNLFLAPSQCKIFHFPVFRNEIDDVTFSYSYSDGIHTYTEKTILKTRLGNITSTVSNENYSVERHLGQITKNLEEMVRRSL